LSTPEKQNFAKNSWAGRLLEGEMKRIRISAEGKNHRRLKKWESWKVEFMDSGLLSGFTSKFVDRIFHESLPGARKESQIAQQASAGHPLSRNPLSVIRKAQRGRDT